MHFSSTFIIAAIPFLTSTTAQPLNPRTDSPPSPTTAYTLTAIHSGDQAVHNQPINAANSSFFIGIDKPGSSCPAGVTACPPGTDTSIELANSMASLNVVVPGGQQIYISPTGALSYTPPHSRAIPAGATSMGFTTDGSSSSATSDVANLVVNGIGSQGWLACPHVNPGGGSGAVVDYQIFANVTGVEVSGTSITHCHDIAIALMRETKVGASAWEYL